MKNSDIINFHKALCYVRNLEGVKFSYAVTMNKRRLKDTVDSLMKAIEPYDRERERINETYCLRENGKPVIKNGVYMFGSIQTQESCEREIAALKERFKTELDDYAELLEQDTEVSIHKIKMENMPENVKQWQLEALIPMIIDFEPNEGV